MTLDLIWDNMDKMNKTKYLFDRLVHMSYKEMFNTIKRIHNKTGRNRIGIFLDVVFCGIYHGAGYVDYEYYNMYDLNHEQRKTIMTRRRSNHYVAMLNPKEYWHLFDNKNEFNEKFSKYLGREWMFINGNNFEEFKNFVQKHKVVMVKPNDLSCGKGIRKIHITKGMKLDKFYEECIKNQTYLIEEVAVQNKEISKLHPDSVNTVRMVTIIADNGKPYVATAVIRIGSGHKVVDNFNSGGVTAMIDIKTGKINTSAINSEGIIFDKHPTTKVKLEGYQIPCWKEIQDLVLKAALVVPEIRLVGWDICVGEKGPLIIEGNQFPAHDLYQPLFGVNGSNEGIVPLFEEIIHRK